MHYLRILFRTFCLAILLLHSPICAGNLDDGDDKFIYVKPINNDQGRLNPQSYEHVPILAYYNSITSSISVRFTHNLGEVNIEVKNITTGELSIVSTSEMYIIVPISGESGIYTIMFILQSNKSYLGVFEI